MNINDSNDNWMVTMEWFWWQSDGLIARMTLMTIKWKRNDFNKAMTLMKWNESDDNAMILMEMQRFGENECVDNEIILKAECNDLIKMKCLSWQWNDSDENKMILIKRKLLW